jgi:hypothetical protein
LPELEISFATRHDSRKEALMSKIADFNQRLGARITSMVSTMWCAYFFAAIALVSLPEAIKSGNTVVIVAWIAQTFLQLVLLSIIMVGQNVASASVEQKINETHEASLGEFELAKEARGIANEELKELKEISLEVHQLLQRIEGKISI